MKKIDIRIKKNRLLKNAYRISKNSELYSFFISEYSLISEDINGNIIVPITEMRLQEERKESRAK